MEVGGSHSESFFCGKLSQNSPKPVLIFWSILDGVSSIQVFFWIFGIFLTLQSPLDLIKLLFLFKIKCSNN